MTQKQLGGLPPDAALRYMEETEELVIVNVAGRGSFDRAHFDGAVDIPTEDIGDEASEKKLLELPKGKPVILYCRRGRLASIWYQKLIQLRPDIPEVSYVAGVPLIDDYNDWARDL
ncbi:MAG: rhodanese-like domain-containing protein [Sutterellaceae bacterium]|nr:rhodanese-like domain-containing protein [Sutterellaceae bacterium]MDD7442321.1 rhodanese-like domain-containing protein [Sutterellaceae bacterium]MDY2868373.1 rhodanese-like domain-containing protein [Mesosutterella sp.]